MSHASQADGPVLVELEAVGRARASASRPVARCTSEAIAPPGVERRAQVRVLEHDAAVRRALER